MKIVQNALFRSCAARFGQIAFWSVKVLKIVTRAWNSLQNEKTVRLPWKLYKTLVSGHAQHVLAKSHFWASKFLKSSHWPEILLKTENSALSKTIVQNPFFRSCVVRFGQIWFLSAKFLKFVKLASNSLQSGKTVRFSWKWYKTLFLGHAQHVLAKSHFGASKFLKTSCGPEILSKTRKQCAFHENCTRRSFQVMRSTSWPNLIFERQSSQNRETGLKFSPKLENSALSMKIVQNALFRSCAARFGQIAFYSVKVSNILKLASNSLQIGKRVRFSGHVHFFKTKKTVRIFERQRS